MLLLIIIAIVILGIVCIVAYENCNVGDWCQYVGVITLATGIIALVISLGCLGEAHIGVNGHIAACQARYDSLVYQYENDVYDNDNDIGKRELIKDIQSWNEDLARNRENQNDFWIGVFIPNIYDQFEFIELNQN